MSYYDNINFSLLNQIPPSSKNILELGCASGRLGELYKSSNPNSKWTGVELNHDCIREAIPRLDHVIYMDLNDPRPEKVSLELYDVIIIGDVIEHLVSPEQCLKFAYEVSAPNAQLFLCIPNMTHFTIIEKMLYGDMVYDPNGLMDETHLKFMSFGSSYKHLTNAGWLPHLNGTIFVGPGNDTEQKFIQSLINSAETLGIPRSTTERNIINFQLIISCVKSERSLKKHKKNISVIVPMNNPKQFDRNIIKSPGIHEIGAQIIPIDNATNPYEALERGKKFAAHDWILFCHQDVFIPEGSGFILSDIIANIPTTEADKTLIGFAGVGDQGNSGLVVDRAHRFDYPASTSPNSIDEFAILLTKNSYHNIDPTLGWHMWATDMCLNSKKMGYQTRIERVPFFHNSVNENGPSTAFLASLEILKEKYRGHGMLNAITGNFQI